MIPVLGMLVLTSVALVVLALGAKWAAEKAIRSGVSTHFADADDVLRTQKPPREWVRDAKKARQFGLRRRGPVEVEIKELLVERIDSLVEYFEGSRFIADDETRAHLISELNKVQQQWRQEDLSQIITA